MKTSIREDMFSFICKKYSRRLVKAAYRGILEREADEAGLATYAGDLNNAADLARAMRNLVSSEEHLKKILSQVGGVVADPKDVFSGLLPGDDEHIRALCDQDRSVDPTVFVDPLGIRVSPDYYPWIAERVGSRHSALPVPNDSYFAEGIEYTALALAIKAAEGSDSFTVVEIGAGWGPWVSASTISARRHGFRNVNLVAFEADEERYAALRAHLALNGIVAADAPAIGSEDVSHWKLLNAAASSENTKLYWPISGGVEDAGMAAVKEPTGDSDYRGKKTAYKEIQALDIREHLTEFSRIDFLHIDIQGAEFELIGNTLPFLEDRVRCMFVGTHSRKIEGDLIELLRSRGWRLLRERPCQFDLSNSAASLTGMTYVDGGQFWLRPGESVALLRR